MRNLIPSQSPATGVAEALVNVIGLACTPSTWISPLTSNEAPVSKINAPRHNLLRPDTTVNLSATDSSDAEGDPLRYDWLARDKAEVFYGETVDITVEETGNVELAVSDGVGGYGLSYVTLTVEDEPQSDCLIHYFNDYSPNFRVMVKLYNLSDTPIENWSSTWVIDDAENITADQGIEVTGSNPYTIRRSTPVPERSWFQFTIKGESEKVIQDLSISHSLEGCVELIPAAE